MQIKDVMTKDIEFIAANVPVRDAALKMRDRRIGFLPVHDGGQAVGTITDRDIALNAVAKGKHDATVEETMSKGIASIPAHAEVAEAARMMKQHGVRRLAVIDETERLCGVVSLGDIAVRAGADKLTGGTLASVAAAPDPKRV